MPLSASDEVDLRARRRFAVVNTVLFRIILKKVREPQAGDTRTRRVLRDGPQGGER